MDPLFEGVSAMVSVCKTRSLQCGNTDTPMFALALNREVDKVCATCLSPEQRGFIIGRSGGECCFVRGLDEGSRSGEPACCGYFSGLRDGDAEFSPMGGFPSSGGRACTLVVYVVSSFCARARLPCFS